MANDSMEDSTLHEELLTPLAAYHELLRRNVQPPTMDAEDPTGILWLRTRPIHGITRKVLSGLELFVLLAHVDWNLWKQQAEKIWRGEMEDIYAKPARLGIDLEPRTNGRIEPVFEIIATSAQTHGQPADVVQVREYVDRLLRERGQVLAEIPVRVGRDTMTSMIFKVMQIVCTHSFLDTLDSQICGEPRRRYEGLRLRYFRPSIESVALTAMELQHLAAISAAGVAVDDIGTSRPEVYTQNPIIVTKSQWTLFAIGATDESERQRGVRHVALTRAIRAGMIPAVYSPICASPSVYSMEIDPAINGKSPKKYREQVWSWIAYTLLCRAPNTSQEVHSLSLNVESLDVAAVHVVRDVLSARDPIAKLFPRAASLATEAVSASRFRLSDPKKKEDADVVIVDSPHVLNDLPVLKKGKDWTTVLLPAWGQAWVRRDDVLATQRWAAGPYPVKSISRVELRNLRDESKDAVIALIRLVGPGVKHLILKAQGHLDSSCFDDWLTEVINVCPKLEMLEIDGFKVHSFQFLMDGYASGKCRLTRFKATRMKIDTEDESLRRLFVALGDRSHPAARYMSEFECSPVAVATISDPIMTATAVGMLEKNDRLRDFELGFNWRETYSNNRFSEYTEPFKAFDKKTISRARAPLDVRQRVAFLSVVAPRQVRKKRSNCRPHAIEKLDANVLSLIFEMAAKCCERRVHIGILHGEKLSNCANR